MEHARHPAWRHGYVSPEALRPRVRHSARREQQLARRRAHLASPAHAPRESERRKGVALVVVMTVITMLTVFVAELMQNTTTAFQVATSERDRLKAEYLAKSGANLTRLLIANERGIRSVVAPFYQMLLKSQPPQINVWDFAEMLLAPFASTEGAQSLSEESGIDFSLMEGLRDTGGTFEIITVPENGKINFSKPLFKKGNDAAQSTAMQLYALTGGYQSPNSPYDPMFSARDPDGFYTTRLDIVSDIIDWWDWDTQRTTYDPGSATVQSGGSEDNVYSQLPDPYVVKNAPYDSIEELRMVRGIGDDFWATFVETEPDNPRTRMLTIYGSGQVNLNQSAPQVLHARVCDTAATQQQPLCLEFLQAAAFVQLLSTAQALLHGIPIFPTSKSFINFLTGGGDGSGMNLYQMLLGLLGPQNPLMLWQPLSLTPQQRTELEGRFINEASIFTIQSTGRVGKAQAQVTMVINVHTAWIPPPGVVATRPPLGVVHYYRLQ